MSMQERPARPGRTKPVPTADAGVDPVDYRPTAQPAPVAEAAPQPQPTETIAPAPVSAPTETKQRATPPPTAPVHAGGPQATVQLGVNVDPDVAQLVMHIKATTGLSKRAIVEKAIRDTWAS